MTTSSPNDLPAPSPGEAHKLASAMETMAGAMGMTLPDPALLQSLANEMFKQEPGAKQFQPGASLRQAQDRQATEYLPLQEPEAPLRLAQDRQARVPLPGNNLPAMAQVHEPTVLATELQKQSAPELPAPSTYGMPEIPFGANLPHFNLPGVPALNLTDFTRAVDPAAMLDAPLYFMQAEFAGMQRFEPEAPLRQAQDGLAKGPPSALPAPAAPQAPAQPAGVTPAVLVHDLKLPRSSFDVYSVRRDFPILFERVHGNPLVWLDNGATSQKPQSVIDRIAHFYAHENSNVHRAAHTLAGRSTDAYEAAREKVRRFVNAGSTREIVWVRGATEGINLVAQTWGKRNIGKGDQILVTHLEHHANIVPWQMLCNETGAKLCVAPVDDNGNILLQEFERNITPRTKLAAITAVSNALGTVTPVAQMIEIAHRYGVKVLVDGAQSVMHKRTDVQALDADWFVFSGHKVFAPTGIGVVYGKQALLDAAPPYQGGGNMIADVTFERTIYQPAPGRFEAGTGNIADAVGLGAAVDYLDSVGLENVQRHEHELMDYMLAGLRTLPIRIIGEPTERAGVVSFVSKTLRPEEIGHALDREGIAVRAGHHCAQPILRRFGLEATVRPSLALYNTCEDIDALINALRRILK